jgi:cell division protease FtsH
MINFYGMSDVAGLMVLEKQRSSFLGPQFGGGKEYSEQMAQKSDDYIKSLLDEHYALVKSSLEKYKEAIETITAELLKIEVISGDRVREIIKAYEEKNGIVRPVEKEETETIEKIKPSEEPVGQSGEEA